MEQNKSPSGAAGRNGRTADGKDQEVAGEAVAAQSQHESLRAKLVRHKKWVLIAVAALLCVVLAILSLWLRAGQRKHEENSLSGRMLYDNYCARCHGEDFRGRKGNPDLSKSKLKLDAFAKLLMSGKGRMPAFSGVLYDSDLEPLYRAIQEKR